MHIFPAGCNLGERVARPACTRCLRPLTHCLCQWIPALDSRTRVLVLQHPDEARHALNTARLAVLGLRNASLCVGRHFDAGLWQVPGYQPWLLFPGQDAEILASADPAIGPAGNPVANAAGNAAMAAAADAAQEPPRLLVVPDGTWRHARQLLAAHPALAALPRAALAGTRLSRYRIRHAEHSQALATIEAVAGALDALEAPRSFAALLKPFEMLVAGQIAAMGHERYERDHVRRAGSRAARQK